ncbi:MAG TPA: phosphoribulokinase [Solirubrobacteraceae bacterium]|nr:phosphoribulokinase [Solirubrobacteraceae bacterium]
MSRPVLLAISGDSGAGKTTLTRGLVRILGRAQVAHLSADHYHRFGRRERAERGLTPLHPAANHLDILEQHVLHLRSGRRILKPVYDHRDGSFAAAEPLDPAPFTIVEGLLATHSAALRELFDVRVFIDTPDDLRRRWKVQRDCSRRGYTTDTVLEELDRRIGDAEEFVRPQRLHADIVLSFMPGDRGDDAHLDAKLVLRPGLKHCDLSSLADGVWETIQLHAGRREHTLVIPGTLTPERSAEVQAAIWDCMHFAAHLRTERLGEFTAGMALGRSEALAIAQLLILHQLVTTRAALAVGTTGGRVGDGPGAQMPVVS